MKHILEFEKFLESVYIPIYEGGAAGHMQHLHEDYDLTFGELKDIIDRSLTGTLNKESEVTEKLDGQAISISWKNGKLIAARNKGHLKKAGAVALDVNGIIEKFTGRGDLSDAFAFAVQDLENAISKIKESDRYDIFREGKRFMAVEVLFPPTTNVINYDIPRLVFHGTLEYDDEGNAIGEDKKSAKLLADLIKEVNAHIQKNFEISPPVFLTVPPHTDFAENKEKFFKKIELLKTKHDLDDSNTIGDWHTKQWDIFISMKEKEFGYKLNDDIKVKLINRFAFDDKTLSIREMNKLIENKEFMQWINQFEKEELKDKRKSYNSYFESIFLELGSTILKNMSGFLAANPDEAVQKIKEEVEKSIKEIGNNDDLELFKKVQIHAEKIRQLGGFKAIVPTEGIVFVFNGRTYKMTGSFAPVNQLTGILKYGKTSR